jgi:hypothetical protein
VAIFKQPLCNRKIINLDLIGIEGNNLFRHIFGLLNIGGGFIMLGCKALDCLANQNKLLKEVDQRYFRGVHFVVGETLRETDKKLFV